MSQAFSEEADPPTPERISAVLGGAEPVWARTVAALEEVGATVEWRYYRDGGWLAKAVRRGQTIAWMRVQPGHFRVSFYLAARFRELLLNEVDLDSTLREQVAAATGRTIALSLELGDASDLGQVLTLIGAKIRAK